MNRSIPLVLAVALFMEHMDSTVIATALPAIAADIDTSPISLKLALTAYLVSLAVFIPISGWMADRFGARRIFALAIGIFLAGSIACAIAGSLVEFVVSRFLQGMGGAMMTPVGRLVLLRSTDKSQLVTAMAWLTIPALIGPMVGPPVGGFLTTFLSWHWIFLINIPIGLAGIVFALRILPDDGVRVREKVDWLGFLLSAGAASGIVFGLSVISLPVLPPAWGIAATAGGVVSLIAYLGHASAHPRPLLDPRLFENRIFALSLLSSNLFRIGAGAVPFLLPLMFQLGFGMTPFESGMITFISAAGAIMMKLIIKRVLSSLGFRTALLFSAAAAALSIAVNGFFSPATPIMLILAALFLGGLMRSMFFTSINALTFSEIAPETAAPASSLTSAFQQVAIAVGVAVAGGVVEVVSAINGGIVDLGAFHMAFFVVAAITTLAIIPVLILPPGAGGGVSGHILRMAGSRAASPVRN